MGNQSPTQASKHCPVWENGKIVSYDVPIRQESGNYKCPSAMPTQDSCNVNSCRNLDTTRKIRKNGLLIHPNTCPSAKCATGKCVCGKGCVNFGDTCCKKVVYDNDKNDWSCCEGNRFDSKYCKQAIPEPFDNIY